MLALVRIIPTKIFFLSIDKDERADSWRKKTHAAPPSSVSQSHADPAADEMYSALQLGVLAILSQSSLCVGEIRKGFFFGKVACLQTLFPFSFPFVDVCWLDDKVNIFFVKLSYRL